MLILRATTVSVFFLTLSCTGGDGDSTVGNSESSGPQTTSATASSTSAGPSCTDDSFEANNTIETAAEIVSGQELSSVICPLDLDYFSFEIDTSSFVSIVGYTNRDDGQLTMEFISPNMAVLDATSGTSKVSVFSPQGVEAMHRRVDESGVYFVRVLHNFGDDVPYTLLLNIFPDITK
jgi:hypothetical protein